MKQILLRIYPLIMVIFVILYACRVFDAQRENIRLSIGVEEKTSCSILTLSCYKKKQPTVDWVIKGQY